MKTRPQESDAPAHVHAHEQRLFFGPSALSISARPPIGSHPTAASAHLSSSGAALQNITPGVLCIGNNRLLDDELIDWNTARTTCYQ